MLKITLGRAENVNHSALSCTETFLVPEDMSYL